jgi:hypothetical protein
VALRIALEDGRMVDEAIGRRYRHRGVWKNRLVADRDCITRPFTDASCGTIRLKLLKIGALVRIGVRRIKIAMASGCPAAGTWGCAAVRLIAAATARGSPA